MNGTRREEEESRRQEKRRKRRRLFLHHASSLEEPYRAFLSGGPAVPVINPASSSDLYMDAPGPRIDTYTRTAVMTFYLLHKLVNSCTAVVLLNVSTMTLINNNNTSAPVLPSST